MMSKIKTNPALAAAFYFILTWAAFPVAALLRSYIKGITFTEAASAPYMITIFAAGSVISAIRMYYKTKK